MMSWLDVKLIQKTNKLMEKSFLQWPTIEWAQHGCSMESSVGSVTDDLRNEKNRPLFIVTALLFP